LFPGATDSLLEEASLQHQADSQQEEASFQQPADTLLEEAISSSQYSKLVYSIK